MRFGIWDLGFGICNPGQNPKSEIPNPKSKGFTLVEVLLAISRMALLTALLGAVLSNCRRTATAAEAAVDRLRKHVVMRETLQTELDLSLSEFSFETSGGRVRGFSFMSYGRWSGRNLKIRSRYAFEPDPGRPAMRLMRYVIAEGVGVDETKEVLFDGVTDPSIEAYSSAASEFVPVENIPEIPDLIRLKFKQTPPLPGGGRELPSAEEFRLILKNGYDPNVS